MKEKNHNQKEKRLTQNIQYTKLKLNVHEWTWVEHNNNRWQFS